MLAPTPKAKPRLAPTPKAMPSTKGPAMRVALVTYGLAKKVHYNLHPEDAFPKADRVAKLDCRDLFDAKKRWEWEGDAGRQKRHGPGAPRRPPVYCSWDPDAAAAVQLSLEETAMPELYQMMLEHAY
jgi:hypothetical protein